MFIRKNSYEDYSNSIFPRVRYKYIKKRDLSLVVELARCGDENAFFRILCFMHKYLMRLTKEFFIQGSESKDVYQEGAIKLINVIEKYDSSKGEFLNFAQSSIRKHIITSINKEQSKRRSVLNKSIYWEDETKNKNGKTVSISDLVPNIMRDDGFIFKFIQKNHEEYLIEKISEVLSPLEHKIFVLRFMEGFTYKEIADKLNLIKIDTYDECVLDSKAVDNAIWRSKPKIKKVLIKMGISPKYIDKEQKYEN